MNRPNLRPTPAHTLLETIERDRSAMLQSAGWTYGMWRWFWVWRKQVGPDMLMAASVEEAMHLEMMLESSRDYEIINGEQVGG